MAKNQYAKALNQARKSMATYHSEIRSQIDCDAACMAAADVFQMGPGRAKAFVDAMIKYENDIGKMFVEDSKSDITLEYSKVTLDKRIREIVGEDNFEPWEMRYGYRIFGDKK